MVKDEMERARRIVNLDKEVQKGRVAQTILQTMESALEARRQAYYIDLVTQSRKEGKVDEGTVWKMVALDDLVQDLDNDIAGGNIAARKLEKISETVEND